MVKKILFYWASSFTIATLGYYLLWLVMPKHYVFGAIFRMSLYHWANPLSYIAIPCFFFGLLSIFTPKNFLNYTIIKQALIISAIIVLTILFSSPFGGMLWHYHDMQAGFFPKNWIHKMFYKGSIEGIQIGWLIILISIPYNFLGCTVSYFLIKKGEKLFLR